MSYEVQLSEKKSEFCRLLVYERMPQYKAYMEAFGANKVTAPAEASKLIRQPEVQAEIKRLRDEKSKDAEWEFMDSIYALKGVIARPEKHSDLVNAVKEINKMLGFEKTTINHISEDGSMTPKAVDPDLVKALADKLTD
jgi:phage terminase small subunit